MTSAHQPQELIDWGWRRGAAHVKAANQAFYAALSARDIGAMQKVWSSDIDIENIGPFSKAAHVGWDAIKKRFEETFGNVHRRSHPGDRSRGADHDPCRRAFRIRRPVEPAHPALIEVQVRSQQ
jgi:hypothetical protein